MANGIAYNRQKMILQYLDEHRTGSVEDFCSLLNISPATVRRELNAMDKDGMLIRIYGGATIKAQQISEEASAPMTVEQEYRYKSERNVDSKIRISRAAAKLIPDDAIIYVNSGSTTHTFIEEVKSKKITIVTNNASAAAIDDIKATLLFVGGELRPQSRSFVGSIAINSMQEIFSTYTVLGTNGLCPKRGLTTTISQECIINQTMVSQTLGKVIVLADHSKIGVTSNFVSVALSKVDILVTDIEPEEEVKHQLEEFGIEIIVA